MDSSVVADYPAICRTLPALLAWLEEPRADKGVRFASDGGQWAFRSYAELAAASRQAASGLMALGVRSNDVVSLALHSGPEFVSAFFGAMLAGAVPSAAAPFTRFQRQSAYTLYTRGILATVRPRVVIAESASVFAFGSARLSGAPRVVTFGELLRRAPASSPSPPDPAAGALLQLTSGSSGFQRAVRVPLQALLNNVRAIHRWLHWSENDTFVSWLPLHHDMGLVGALLCATVAQSSLWLLRPEHFIRDPDRYVRCFGAGGGTLSTIASWGIEYITRRVSQHALASLDLSEWKALVVGAERINADALRRFQQLLEPFGLRRGVLLPAYGMAEASLAVTGLALGQEWTSVHTSDGEVVGCGSPLSDVTVELVADSGVSAPQPSVGEIVVRSPALASGYVGAGHSSSATRLRRGVLHTGDAGLLVDGQLFPLGRFGDSVKVRGRALFAEDVELVAVRHGVPRARVAALLGMHREAPTVVVVIEKMNCAPALLAKQLRELTAGAELVVLPVAGGTILRTSSGKPRRRALWSAYLQGNLASLGEHTAC